MKKDPNKLRQPFKIALHGGAVIVSKRKVTAKDIRAYRAQTKTVRKVQST